MRDPSLIRARSSLATRVSCLVAVLFVPYPCRALFATGWGLRFCLCSFSKLETRNLKLETFFGCPTFASRCWTITWEHARPVSHPHPSSAAVVFCPSLSVLIRGEFLPSTSKISVPLRLCGDPSLATRDSRLATVLSVPYPCRAPFATGWGLRFSKPPKPSKPPLRRRLDFPST